MPKKIEETAGGKGSAIKSKSKKSISKSTTEGQDRKAPQTQSARANLVFPIPRIMNLMKTDRLNERVGKNGAVMMTAILENVAGKLFVEAN